MPLEGESGVSDSLGISHRRKLLFFSLSYPLYLLTLALGFLNFVFFSAYLSVILCN